MNDDLDELLKSALARSEPPADFSARLLTHIERERTRRTPSTKPWTIFAVAAAGLILTLSGYLGYARFHAASLQTQNPELQLVFALQLTSEKIAAIDARLKRSSPQLQLRDQNLKEKR